MSKTQWLKIAFILTYPGSFIAMFAVDHFDTEYHRGFLVGLFVLLGIGQFIKDTIEGRK